MKTIKIRAFSFNELKKDAKQKALDWYRNGMDYLFLGEDMQEKLEELLKKYKIKSDDAKCMYDLNYCQGSGAMFTGRLEWKKYLIKVEHSGHYYHYNSKEINIYNLDDSERDILEKVHKDFNDLYIVISEALANYGYKILEAENKDENIAENIRSNEYLFTKEGSRTAVL